MDRTLVRKNTAQLYVRYQRRIGEASRADTVRVAWWLLQYTFGVVDAEDIATRAIRTMRGKSETAFAARCDDWFQTDVVPHVSDEARRTVARHRDSGDLCAIVTGASRYSAEPLARVLEIPHVIATELECDDAGLFTGRHVPPLCYGHGKIERTQKLAEERGFALEEASFYTDSISDLPLLEVVKTPVVVNPDPRLRRVAKKRGWRIEIW